MSEIDPRQPISIGVLLSALNRGGAQRQVVALARGLVELGWSVQVVALRSGGQLAADLRTLGVPVVELGGRGQISNMLARCRLARRPELREADVVYSFLPAANVTASIMFAWRRRSTVVWGVRDSGMPLSNYDLSTRVIGWLARRLRRSPQLIICNSAAALEHYGSIGYPSDRMVVIPNGIDVGRYRSDAEAREVERAARGWSADELVILLLGRADPMKGHGDALEAMKIVARSQPSALLWIVGDHSPQFAASLTSRASELGIADRVRLEDATQHPERAINAADLVLSASRYGEGFSNVLAEGLACGKPVVGTEVGDARLVVANDGKLVPPGAPDQLAAAILEVLGGPSSDAHAQRRSERIADEFSLARLAERTAEALLGAIGES